MQPIRGHVELVTVPELDLHEVALLPGELHVDQPLEETDTVIPVHDRVADGQLIDLKRRSLVAAGLAATAALEAAFAEQLSSGKEMKFFVQQVKAARQRLMAAVDQAVVPDRGRIKGWGELGGVQLIVGEHLAQVFGLAG